MNEIEIKIGENRYFLTNLNNGSKYTRAKKEAGENATPESVLAYYDKRAGYIQDENGNKIENGRLWQKEQKRLKEKNEFKIKCNRGFRYLKFVGEYFILPIIVAYLIWRFGWNS